MPLPKGGKGERAVNRARRPAGTLDRDLRTTDPIEAAPSLGVCFYSAAAAVGRFLVLGTPARKPVDDAKATRTIKNILLFS